jgi:hypothetical protein
VSTTTEQPTSAYEDGHDADSILGRTIEHLGTRGCIGRVIAAELQRHSTDRFHTVLTVQWTEGSILEFLPRSPCSLNSVRVLAIETTSGADDVYAGCHNCGHIESRPDPIAWSRCEHCGDRHPDRYRSYDAAAATIEETCAAREAEGRPRFPGD